MKKLRLILSPVYLALSLLLILWPPFRLLELHVPDALTARLDLVWAGMALLAFLVWGLWRKRPCRLMGWGFVWICLSLLLAQGERLLSAGSLRGFLGAALNVLQGARPILGPMVYALFTCFFLGYTAGEEGLRRFLRAACALWTLWLTALAAAGLWAGATGTLIHNAGSHFIGIRPQDHRLYLLAYCTDTGSMLASGILIAVLGVSLVKSRAARAAYLAAACMQLLALSLTDARSAFIGLGACAGLLAAILLLSRRPALPAGGKAALLAGLMAAGTAAVFALCVLLERLCFGVLGLPGSRELRLFSLIPSASAEAVSAHRSIFGADPLSGRLDVWAAVFRLLRDQPRLLLTGTTILDWRQSLLPYTTTGLQYAHAHSMYLQILMELGIPGLVIAVVFLCCAIAALWRLVTAKRRPLWCRLTALPTAMMLISGLAECHTMPGLMLPVLPVLFIGLGLVCALGEREGKPAHGARI